MRIAMVTETFPPEINGVALTVAGLAQGLRDAGHAVQVVRPRQTEDDADENGPDILVRGARLPKYPGLQFGLPTARRLRKLWKDERPDAIYAATEGPLGYSALRAARALGIPAATGFHTRFDDFARHYGFGFLTPVVFAYLRRFHRQGAATLVPTIELRDFLIENKFGNVVLLRRAVDNALFSPTHRDEALRAQWGLKPGQIAVIYVGRIAPEKNLPLAVRAFREIQKIHRDARYIWIGDGPARAALAAENPDFIFAGIQRGDELARHFASADLFLFPSLTETFGNVTLEALASGLPTVAFDYGAAREHLTGECGRRVAFANEDAFLRATLDLVRSDVTRTDIREAAVAAVAELNPVSVTASFAKLLAGLGPTNNKLAGNGKFSEGAT
ncbi:MAG: glycosyltransferase family 1 protein [Rudaea sp.]|uniref:glycosyltransferase family 4 protein n=1 Tax=unclassified Rudaea TaxID=2627037 RepID=UPI001484D8F6|nr:MULTISPECIES: glycosyltransferase family 1 protein [unclassified Rudaea]MBN8887732.1 glycosyltransferase family 1 protein [Rudaea sp.]